MISSTRYKDCEVVTGELKTYIDLIRLGKMEFDVILGMNWLSACHAYVDCYEKRVIFRMKGIPKFIFEGIKDIYSMLVITAMRAMRLLRQGCQEFLVIVMS